MKTSVAIRSLSVLFLIMLGNPLFTLSARKSIDNPVTKAVLEVYAKNLKANPKDYNTLFLRANEYFNHGIYDLALSDINDALELAPAKDSDLRFELLMRRAAINRNSGNFEAVTDDLGSALAYKPDNIVAIYHRAQAFYNLGRYADSKTDFKRMLYLNPRSPEGLLGMAMISQRENNLGIAAEYLEQAVSINPNNADLYVRRAEVKHNTGDDNGAVDDIVMAISTDSKNTEAFDLLAAIAQTNYPAAIAGLTKAVNIAPDNGLFRYLRAGMASAHSNFSSALTDYRYILDRQLYDYKGINASIAECLFSLGKYDEALDQINDALAAITDNADYYVLKSKILRAKKDYPNAIESSAKALAVNKKSSEALAEMGLAYLGQGKNDQALSLLGEAMDENPDNPRYAMLSGWASGLYAKRPDAGRNIYLKVAGNNELKESNVRSLKGFANLFLGNSADAETWMDNILTASDDKDGYTDYLACCFYASKGDNDKAMELAEKALGKGYANYHNWLNNNDGNINPGQLRKDIRFIRLLDRYGNLFEN